MPTYRLTLEYEGTRYRGWQEQKNARTVAGEVRQAFEAAAGEKVELAGSGRTDAGVHARAQVAHVKTAGKLRREEILRAVNEALRPSWFTAVPRITANTSSPSASASLRRLSTTTPMPSPRQ